MARTPKPWFRKQTGWWMVTLGGKQHKLAEGRENRKLALKKFHELSLLVAEAPESSDIRVASVCDAFFNGPSGTNRRRRIGAIPFTCKNSPNLADFSPSRICVRTTSRNGWMDRKSGA